MAPVRLRGSVKLSEKLFEYRQTIKKMKRTLLGTGLGHKIDHAQCSEEEILVRMQSCLVLETQQGSQSTWQTINLSDNALLQESSYVAPAEPSSSSCCLLHGNSPNATQLLNTEIKTACCSYKVTQNLCLYLVSTFSQTRIGAIIDFLSQQLKT